MIKDPAKRHPLLAKNQPHRAGMNPNFDSRNRMYYKESPVSNEEQRSSVSVQSSDEGYSTGGSQSADILGPVKSQPLSAKSQTYHADMHPRTGYFCNKRAKPVYRSKTGYYATSRLLQAPPASSLPKVPAHWLTSSSLTELNGSS